MISVIVATYGDRDHWRRVARSAIDSAESQTVEAEVLYTHGATLARARNFGAYVAHGERLVFLDADDWLAPDFCERIVEPENVLQPLTAYHMAGYQTKVAHYLEPRDDLIEGNHLIVGCPVDREVFMDVGGFDEWPVYEDWALWLKIRAAGGSFGKTTGVYNVTVNPNGRNQDPRGPETYDQIRRLYS